MDSDPWTWSEADVQEFFRTRAISYAHGDPLPPVDTFLQTLEANAINGETLLTALETDALRQECGLIEPRPRATVLRCIRQLRLRSPKYVEHLTPPWLRTANFLSIGALPPTPVQHHIEPLQHEIEPAVPTTEVAEQGAEQDVGVGENTRQGEYQVQDAQGRKRRKLNLSKPDTPPAQTEPGPIDLEMPAEGFLPDSAISIDELFYGSTSFGQETVSLATGKGLVVLPADRAAGPEEENFQFQSTGRTPGEASVVHGRMLHFLGNAETETLMRGGRSALAIQPYRKNGATGHPATVIQFQSQSADSPVAIKERFAFLHAANPEQHMEGAGEWEFLMSKYKANDEDGVLPQYGDSETAAEEVGTETSNSDAESMASESVAPDELTTEDVSAIIDDTFKAYVSEWESKLAKLEEKKAWKTWKMTKRSRTLRDGLTQRAHANIDRFQARLKAQKSRLLEAHWTNEAEVRNSCRNSQVTVECIEEQRWMIDVWARKQEPFHEKKPQKSGPRAGNEAETSDRQRVHERPLYIPESDRFSVSPPDPNHDEAPGHEDDTTYLADDEEFHTPVGSPASDPPINSPVDTQIHPDDLDDFIDPSEELVLEDGHTVFDGADALDDEEADLAVLHHKERSDSGKNSTYVPEAGSDSDDLPSPSMFASKSVKREPKPVTPAKPGIPSHAAIDLTGDSPSSSAPTPATRKPKKPKAPRPLVNPENISPEEVDSWNMAELAEGNHREHILLKMLRNAGVKMCNALFTCYLQLQSARFTESLVDTLMTLQDEGNAALDNHNGKPLRLAAAMFLHWFYPDLLNEQNVENIPWDSVYDVDQLELFGGKLHATLKNKQRHLFKDRKTTTGPGSLKNPHVILSSDDAVPEEPSPKKKRKRQVVERSQAGLDVRKKASERHRKLALAESQPKDSSQLMAMVASDPAHSGVHINPVVEDPERHIFILDKIARKMKEHQIKGARFLWMMITGEGAEGDGGSGCILAHTMGLGKTMQTIAFLAAVNEAAQSEKRSIRDQLPKHLRNGRGRSVRVMILCPPGLIQNWNREIDNWAYKKLGTVFCFDSSVKAPDRLGLLADWKECGGALILGYELFRRMVNVKDGKGTKTTVSDEAAAALEKLLLETPDIVVADEAHQLKNEKSGVASAASRFKTESKIALTGTPMSNDTLEVYALVSWVSPAYLGDPAEFKDHYAEPIKQGLYADSTKPQQRKSIRKLKMLHDEIKDIFSRANIEALRGSIPPKVEFVIFISLETTQLELYRRYIEAVKSFIDSNNAESGAKKTSQVVFLSMLSVLTLLTNHPYCFKEKLLEPSGEKDERKKGEKEKGKKGKGKKEKKDEDAELGGATPSTSASGMITPLQGEFATVEEQLEAEAAHVSAQGLTPERIRQILGGPGDGSDIGTDPTLSSKVTIFLDLLRKSIDVGDRAIVFTQRLPLLDYLGELLKRENIPAGRIDGSNRTERMQLLEDFENGVFDVMTVSTKAGGVGLNMQCANRVFIFDSGFNPTLEEQAIGRAYRLGQRKPVYVYRFVVSGTFEMDVYNKQLFKTSLAQRVVDKKNPQRNAKRSPGEYLYPPKEATQEDIRAEIGKDKDVLDKLLLQHGPGHDTMIRDVKTMETLTQEAVDEPLDAEEQKLLEEETRDRQQRAREKKAAATAGLNGVPSSTMPSMGRGYRPPMPAPPPASTFAAGQGQPHPLGGLPSSSRL